MKTILISGGSDGLGKALAEKLAQDNRVVILANDKEKTSQVSKSIACDYVVADVTDALEVERAVNQVIEKYTKIDCLVNNAGIWIEGALDTNDPERIRAVIDVNAIGTIFLTRAVLPVMKKEKKGRIINVVSQAGVNAKPERTVYNASKWAITGFTKSLEIELAPYNISVVGFYPGAMKTKLFEKAGVTKNPAKFAKYMELSDVVRALEFIIETPDNVAIREFGMEAMP